jgi:acylphosphatase
VRNLPDGSVEAVLEGEPAAIESLVRLCREGPRGSDVREVDVQEQSPRGLATFEIR